MGAPLFSRWSSPIILQRQRLAAGRARLAKLELKPNCLLTRFPVVFVGGPIGLFRLHDNWNEIPAFLREHGYEVYSLQTSFKQFNKSVVNALADLATPCHLIADASLTAEIEFLSRESTPQIASLTLVRSSARATRSSALTASDFRPSRTLIETLFIPVTRLSWRDWPAFFLIRTHNRTTLRRRSGIDGRETGDFASRDLTWSLEDRFLEHAVTLAERDMVSSPVLNRPTPVVEADELVQTWVTT